MDDEQFQSWMNRLAQAGERFPAPGAGAIQLRARLRRRLEAEERATRPIRIAEAAAGIACWLLALGVVAGLGSGALVASIALTAVIAAGLRVISLKKI